MTQIEIKRGSRIAVISANDEQGPFSTRLYVNCQNGLTDASATLICKKAKTLKGAHKQAAEMLEPN